MVGIERTPVGGDFIMRVFFFVVPEKFHLVRADTIVGSGDAAGPCDGDSGVTTFGVGEYGLVIGVLATTVDLNQSRNLVTRVTHRFGIAIDGRHHRLLPFKNTNAVAQDLENNTVFFPFLQNLGIERLCTRVEASPHGLSILRHLMVV